MICKKLSPRKIIKNKMAEKNKETKNENLIVIIRISGMVKVNEDIENALYRLKLRRKYSCVIVKPTKDILGFIKKVKYYIAYGEIDEKTLVELLKARGLKIGGKKIEGAEKIAESLIAGKTLKDLGLKPFFRLHPPRKGIKSKLQYPKGVLGNNKKDINKLVGRML